MSDPKSPEYWQGVEDQTVTNETPWGFVNPPPHHTYSDPQKAADYAQGSKDARPSTFLVPNNPVRISRG